MNDLARTGGDPADENGIAVPPHVNEETFKAELATLDLPGGEAAVMPPLQTLSQLEVRAIVLSLMVAMFLTALDQTIVATALPTIGRQFMDVTNLSWVITAYLLSSTSAAPVFGSLSDVYGRRVMMMTAFGLFLIGSILCALAPTLLILILARFLQGAGGGGILPLVQTVLADLVTPRQRAQYQASFSMVWVSAGIAGPVLGGVIAEHMHWSLIFWINVPLVLLAVSILSPKMKKLPVHHKPRKLDLLGGMLLTAAAITLLLVLTWGGNYYAWLSPPLLALMGSVLGLSCFFIWHARRADEPFLPLPLLTGPVVPFAIAGAACAIGTLVGLIVHMPMYYESVYHLTASEAGLALIPIVALSVPGATAAGRVMMYMKHYKWISLLGLSVGVIVTTVLAVATPLPLWALLSLLAVMALGLGTAFPVTVVSVQAAVGRHLVGTVTGAMNSFRSLMAAMSVALFTAILLAALGGTPLATHEHPDFALTASSDMIAAFRYVFFAAAMLLCAAVLSIACMQERLLGDAPSPSDTVE